MEIRKSEESGVTLLQLSGEIDLHASPQLREALHALVDARVPALAVDFTGVQYIDSSGLATLIEYVREAKPHDGRISLFGLQPKVKMVFELVRLNELFAITDSKDAALAALATTPAG